MESLFPFRQSATSFVEEGALHWKSGTLFPTFPSFKKACIAAFSFCRECNQIGRSVRN